MKYVENAIFRVKSFFQPTSKNNSTAFFLNVYSKLSTRNPAGGWRGGASRVSFVKIIIFEFRSISYGTSHRQFSMMVLDHIICIAKGADP